MDKEDVVYIHNGILLSIVLAATWMELETHTKWCKSERKRQILYDITYLESNIQHKQTFLQKRNKLMDLENRLVVATGEGEGVG